MLFIFFKINKITEKMNFLILYDLISIIFHVKTLYDVLSLKGIKLRNCLQLTSMSFFSTLIYFIFSFLNTILNSNYLLNNTIAFCFCISGFVFQSFWILYFVFPKSLNSQELKMSFMMSFSLHGGNFLFLLFKIILIMKSLTSVNFNILSILVISTLYVFLGKVIYTLFEIPIYPLFKKGAVLILLLTIFSVGLVKLNNIAYCALINIVNNSN
jgi:hypothetical protein